MIRVAVTGGRTFTDATAVDRALDAVARCCGVGELWHGGARGADMLAAHWAWRRGVPVRAFPADWRRLGNSAGPRRNRRMVAERPDLVVAFPGGSGTADMVAASRKAGLRVWEPAA